MKPINNTATNKIYLTGIFGLLTLSGSVMAHQDASDPTFCALGEKVEIGTVDISGRALDKLLKGKPVDCPIGIKDVKEGLVGIGNNKKLRGYVGGVMTYRNAYSRHDFFDETPARLAYAYASCLCASMINDGYDPSEVRPMLEGPAILLDETHHVDYDLTDGLQFSCQVCESRF